MGSSHIQNHQSGWGATMEGTGRSRIGETTPPNSWVLLMVTSTAGHVCSWPHSPDLEPLHGWGGGGLPAACLLQNALNTQHLLRKGPLCRMLWLS